MGASLRVIQTVSVPIKTSQAGNLFQMSNPNITTKMTSMSQASNIRKRIPAENRDWLEETEDGQMSISNQPIPEFFVPGGT
jgi:hypothetical protein